MSLEFSEGTVEPRRRLEKALLDVCPFANLPAWKLKTILHCERMVEILSETGSVEVEKQASPAISQRDCQAPYNIISALSAEAARKHVTVTPSVGVAAARMSF